MRLIILFICLVFLCKAQDKIYYADGSTRSGVLVSVGQEFVFFKINDTSAIEKISKSELVLAVDKAGTRYLIAKPLHAEVKSYKLQTPAYPHPNLLGVQPLDIFVGRIGLYYERLSLDDKLGVVIPFSLSFNPFGSLYKSARSPALSARGVYNYIGGLDLNVYPMEGEFTKLFFGPRLRYGTDVMLNQSEALSVQTQFGLRIGNKDSRFIQHASFGIGFVKVISSKGLAITNKQEFRGWYSLNYRASFAW